MTAGLIPAVSVLGQDSVSAKRQNRDVAIGSSVVYSLGLVGLNALWYADYERSSFQSFNDNKEWLQMDKIGHAYSTYTLTNLSYELYRKGNEAEQRRPLVYASTSAFLFLTTVEVFDGFSKEWGFSWGDFTANTAGIGIFVAQELIFEKQIMRLKYSYLNTKYSKLRPNTLGGSTLQSAFKDYNGQTYWLSFNPITMVNKDSKVPKWINLSLGYGINNQLIGDGGTFLTTLENGEQLSFTPYRQYYLSLDVDWDNIPTNSKLLKLFLRGLNIVKLPFPTLEFAQSKIIFHPIYF